MLLNRSQQMPTTLDIVLSAVYLAVGMAPFAAAIVLAVLFHYGITPHIRCNNNWFPPPPINYVLPQQPPPAHFYPPVPQQAPAINEYSSIHSGGDKEKVLGQMEIGVQEGGNGSVTGAELPHIQPSPNLSSHHPSTGATPCPEGNYPTATDLARYLVRLGLGTAGPSGSPVTEQSASNRPRNIPIHSATSDPHDIFISSTSELDLVWDNLNTPYDAFFPQSESSHHWETAEYPSIIHWDEPVQITT